MLFGEDGEHLVFVRVYRMPAKLTDGHCFGAGKPITFTNVDWFHCPKGVSREGLIKFIMAKRYFDPEARFLLVGDSDDFTFTFGAAPRDDLSLQVSIGRTTT